MRVPLVFFRWCAGRLRGCARGDGANGRGRPSGLGVGLRRFAPPPQRGQESANADGEAEQEGGQHQGTGLCPRAVIDHAPEQPAAHPSEKVVDEAVGEF